MTKLKPSPLYVSDHAIVRYCERVLGMDMAGVRRVIYETCAGAHAVGASRVIVGGFKYEIRESNVVTISPAQDGNLPSQTAQRLAVRR